jgi:hypothetical protein
MGGGQDEPRDDALDHVAAPGPSLCCVIHIVN